MEVENANLRAALVDIIRLAAEKAYGPIAAVAREALKD
jgi:hypothetical protein